MKILGVHLKPLCIVPDTPPERENIKHMHRITADKVDLAMKLHLGIGMSKAIMYVTLQLVNVNRVLSKCFYVFTIYDLL